MTSRRRAFALALSAVTIAGCGGGAAMDDPRGDNGDNALAESDVATVLDAKRRIDAACGSDGSVRAERSPEEIEGAVSAIVSVTEQYPGRVYETGNEDRAVAMRQIARETSTQLRRCGIFVEADRLAAVTARVD